eukprot:Nitzschia sp. Nitz4//scaffold79_size90958//70568//72428//NITZ4_005036-RA/size90958-processed-gene-0.120-mRNA-1//-1//CDS//3329558282//5611//frame0
MADLNEQLQNEDRHLPQRQVSSSDESFGDSSFNSRNSHPTYKVENDIHAVVWREDWSHETLSIIVVGASGDLAKKKTYPSLLSLYTSGLLPRDVVIWGYARSVKTHQEFRDHLFAHLAHKCHSQALVLEFLSKCFYHSGKSYGDENAYGELIDKHIGSFESAGESNVGNRLYYLAVPPNVFRECWWAIKQVGMAPVGWTRVITEKPFGRDLESCNELLTTSAEYFEEHHLYRIDHYLGKEIVQNMFQFRFANSMWEWVWHRHAIENVTFTFKEPFGTEGRGGYFDNYGIIRDIIQNHLLQVLAVFAMEPPAGDDGGSQRDAKTEVLKNMDIITMDDVLLGQYEGYADDPSIKNKDTNCPTYAALRCWINTPRWEGVPFLMQAGKAMDEGLVEVRVRFKAPKTLGSLGNVSSDDVAPNELVMRLQPNPSIELHGNIKTPGLERQPMASVMALDYNEDIPNLSNPDAYTRLLLDVLRDNQGSFVRDDELQRSWEIFTPILHAIEKENIQPETYKFGSTGPDGLDEWMEKMGKFNGKGPLQSPPHSNL